MVLFWGRKINLGFSSIDRKAPHYNNHVQSLCSEEDKDSCYGGPCILDSFLRSLWCSVCIENFSSFPKSSDYVRFCVSCGSAENFCHNIRNKQYGVSSTEEKKVVYSPGEEESK